MSDPTGPEEAPAATAPSDGDAPSDGPLYKQPWVRFAVGFAVLISVFEVFYQVVALESDAFRQFTAGLARSSGFLLEPLYERVTVMKSRVATNQFVVTVNYGCDGIQLCTLMMSAVLAFPATVKQKFVGVVGGVLWLQAWNVVRIATLVIIGGFNRDFFEPVHVYVWPTLLVIICLASWMAWARWTVWDDERRELA